MKHTLIAPSIIGFLLGYTLGYLLISAITLSALLLLPFTGLLFLAALLTRATTKKTARDRLLQVMLLVFTLTVLIIPTIELMIG